MSIQVGCRRFCKSYNLLDIRGASERKVIKDIPHAADKAPIYLWINRGKPWLHC